MSEAEESRRPRGSLPSGLRVLLVEDDRFSARILEGLLTVLGCSVSIAIDGSSAVRALTESAPDAVFLDLQLSDFDGLEVLRRANGLLNKRSGTTNESKRGPMPNGSTSATALPPIIALTGHDGPDVRIHCLDAGMVGFVTKPVEGAGTLEAALAMALAPNGGIGGSRSGDRRIPDSSTGVDLPQAPPPVAAPPSGDRSHPDTKPQNTEHPIVRVDPDLAELIPEYLEDAQSLADDLLSSLDGNDLDGARRRGHQLKGSGGAYGFDEISRAGLAVETACHEGAADRARAATESLRSYLRRVRWE